MLDKDEAIRLARETIETLLGMIDDGMSVVGDDDTYLGNCVNPGSFEVLEAREALASLVNMESS
jgi:hypothetical protein